MPAWGDATPIKAAKLPALNIVRDTTSRFTPGGSIYTCIATSGTVARTKAPAPSTPAATVTMSTSTAVSSLHSAGLLGAMIQGQRAEAACRSSSTSPASPVASPPASPATDAHIRSQRTRDAARERISDFVMLDSLVAGNRAVTRSRDAAPTKPRDAEQESVYSTSSFASTRGLLKKTLSGWRH